MREFSRRSMGINAFSEFVNEVYNVEENQVFRKREKLNQAFMSGYGSDFAPMSIWSGINAVTQVETSTRNTTAAKVALNLHVAPLVSALKLVSVLLQLHKIC